VKAGYREKFEGGGFLRRRSGTISTTQLAPIRRQLSSTHAKGHRVPFGRLSRVGWLDG